LRIVVTGGTGFIGRHLVQTLAQLNHEVHTVSRRAAPIGQQAIHHSCDVESVEALRVAQNADVLVHLAGQSDASASFADPALFARVNSSGTLNMLEAARRTDALFVLASSQRVYSPKHGLLREDDPFAPSDPYGYTKLIAEKWVEMYRKVYGLRTVVLRFFSVYGPGQSVGSGSSGVVPIYMHEALAGKPLLVNNSNLRDFTYVTDVVKGISLCIDKPAALGQAFNIATGVGTSVRDLAFLIKEITGSQSEIRVLGDSTDECLVANIDKARDVLQYRPKVSLRTGLEQYYGSLRNSS